MHLRPRVALLFTLAAAWQLSPTIAGTQECVQQTMALPVQGIASALTTAMAAQCTSFTTDPKSDCVVDLSNSTFASICKSAGGEVYELDVTFNCPSSAADGTQKITANNHDECFAKICTVEDLNTLFAEEKASVASSFRDGCSVETYAIASGSIAIRVSTTLIMGALVAGLLFLVDVVL